MSIDIKINLFTKAIQTDKSGNKNETDFFAEGTYAEKSGCVYLTYKETELSGMEGTATTYKISPDSLSIIRFGAYNSKLEFKQGEETVSNYKTPYGSILLKINTALLDISLKQTGKSNIHLKYTLAAAGEEALDYEIIINFEKL